jgi:exopolyphosphatase/guanosine-5'-triphosphate,3'-diphosphate pyrophosphatase
VTRVGAVDIGTNTTRLLVADVVDGEAFLGEVEWSYGFATRLLSGEEEAALTLRGVGEVSAETLVFDVGGGSTELVLDGRSFSLDLGSVRLTEQLGEDAEAIGARVRPLLPELEPEDAIGVSATVTTLAALDLGLAAYDRDLVHGHVLTAEAVDGQLQRLADLPLDERRRVPALDPERAPVIVAGAAIVREVLRRYRLDSLRASDRDLLQGAALAAAELPERAEGAVPPTAFTCC